MFPVQVHTQSPSPFYTGSQFTPMSIHSLAKQHCKDGLEQKLRAACVALDMALLQEDEEGRTRTLWGKGVGMRTPTHEGQEAGWLLTAPGRVRKEEESLQATRASQKLSKLTWLPVLHSHCTQKMHHYSCYQNWSHSLETSVTKTTLGIIWS